MFLPDLLHQIVDQKGNIAAAGPQRRQFHLKGAEPVVKVLSEPILGNRFFQITGCGGENAHIGRNIFIGLRQVNVLILNDLQQSQLR